MVIILLRNMPIPGHRKLYCDLRYDYVYVLLITNITINIVLIIHIIFYRIVLMPMKKVGVNTLKRLTHIHIHV